MSKFYLAIDQGGHSSRALLFDDEGRQLKKCSRTLSTQRGENGYVEHDTRELLKSVLDAVNDLLGSINDSVRKNIVACGVATQRSSVLSWNADGEALSPVLSWQDVRAAAHVESLSNHAKKIQQLSGLPLTPYYGASKLHWLFDEFSQQEIDADKLRFSPMVSYLLFHLLSNQPYLVDHSNAQRTQLMSIKDMNWSPWLCDCFEVPKASLPECVAMCSEYGSLLDTGIPVTAVCGDQNAAFYGVGDLDTSTALINLGSGAFILRSLPEYCVSAEQLTGIAYSGTAKSDEYQVRYLREATVNGAGNALSWLENQHGVKDISQHLPDWLEQKKSPPIFLNTIGGLGSPWWKDQLLPQFVVDGNEPDDSDKAVAVVESILFMLQANLILMQHEASISHLRLSGGLSQLDGLCQKLANLTQLSVERVENPEATSRGVAWLAAGCPLGWNNSEAPGTKHFYPEKDPLLSQRYEIYMEKLKAILEKTS